MCVLHLFSYRLFYNAHKWVGQNQTKCRYVNKYLEFKFRVKRRKKVEALSATAVTTIVT